MTPRFAMALAAAAATSGATPAEANLCKEFGLPSYTATRTITFPDKTITAKVFVSGDRFREEIPEGSRTIIRMGDMVKSYTYDEVSKRGIVVPAPALQKGEMPDKNDPNTRVSRTKTDTEQTVTIEKKKGEDWALVLKVVCRLDGVLLEQVFSVPMKDKEVMATLKQTDIVQGPIAEDVFKIPNHITLIEPPPQKKQ